MPPLPHSVWQKQPIGPPWPFVFAGTTQVQPVLALVKYFCTFAGVMLTKISPGLPPIPPLPHPTPPERPVHEQSSFCANAAPAARNRIVRHTVIAPFICALLSRK